MTAQSWHRAGALIGLLILVALTAEANQAVAQNATVTGGDVQLFKSYPNFSPSTLLKFRLSAGPLVAVIPNGSRVMATGVKVVSNQEWFEVTYSAGARSYAGWIYAGDVGSRRYLRLDRGAERRLRRAEATSEESVVVSWAALGGFLGPAPLHAQTGVLVPVPPVRTNPLMTLGIAVAYIVVFLSAMVAVKRWLFPESNAYTFLTSFAILLLLGAITQTVWSDLIGVALAQGTQ
jgi:hypothetical protein